MKPVYPRAPKYVDGVYAAGVYEGGWRTLIHLYKYKGKDYLGEFFGYSSMKLWKIPWDKVDVIVPVPSPFWRSWKRGSNSTLALARQVSKIYKKPLWPHVLKRKHGFPTQTSLTRRERKRNAELSFIKNKKINPLQIKTALIIDDVMTTGATLSVSARLLKGAGFQYVYAATLAYEPFQNSNRARHAIAKKGPF